MQVIAIYKSEGVARHSLHCLSSKTCFHTAIAIGDIACGHLSSLINNTLYICLAMLDMILSLIRRGGKNNCTYEGNGRYFILITWVLTTVLLYVMKVQVKIR